MAVEAGQVLISDLTITHGLINATGHGDRSAILSISASTLDRAPCHCLCRLFPTYPLFLSIIRTSSTCAGVVARSASQSNGLNIWASRLLLEYFVGLVVVALMWRRIAGTCVFLPVDGVCLSVAHLYPSSDSSSDTGVSGTWGNVTMANTYVSTEAGWSLFGVPILLPCKLCSNHPMHNTLANHSGRERDVARFGWYEPAWPR